MPGIVKFDRLIGLEISLSFVHRCSLFRWDQPCSNPEFSVVILGFSGSSKIKPVCADLFAIRPLLKDRRFRNFGILDKNVVE